MRSTNWIDLTWMLTRWIIVFLQYQHLRHWTRSIWNTCCETLNIIASSFSSCLHALDSRSCITRPIPLPVAILYIAEVRQDVRQSTSWSCEVTHWACTLPVYVLLIDLFIFCWQISQWTIYQSNFWINGDFHHFYTINWPFFGLTVMSIDCFSNVMYDLPSPSTPSGAMCMLLVHTRSLPHWDGVSDEHVLGCYHHQHQGEEGLHCTTESGSWKGRLLNVVAVEWLFQLYVPYSILQLLAEEVAGV